MNKRLVIVLVLAAACFAYLPVKDSQFTNWDDDRYIVNNEDIQKLSAESIQKFFTGYYEGNYHPFTMLSYAVDYSVNGLDPFVFHFTNLLFHLLNVLLVFFFVYRLTGKQWVALFAALLFGIHPLQVESVAWISERKNVLYGFFFLSSLLVYTWYAKEGNVKYYWLSLLLFLFSLLSKGMAVSLALCLPLIDHFLHRKIFSKKVLLEKTPFFLLALAAGIVAIYAQQLEVEGGGSYDQYHLAEKLVIAGYGFFQYMVKLLYPYELAIFYPYPVSGIPGIYWLSFGLSAAIFGLVAYFSLKNRKILFCCGFFLVNIVFVLQLIPVGKAVMADRYVYIPLIGFFMLLGYGLEYLLQKKPGVKSLLIGLTVVYAGFLIYKTNSRCRVWQNSVNLWSDQVKKYPGVDFAWDNLGLAKATAGNFKGAIADYNSAIALNPQFALAYNNRGVAWGELNQIEKAVEDFNRALKLKPEFAGALKNRGRALDLLNNYEAALADYDKLCKLEPANPLVWNKRGIDLIWLGQYGEAVRSFNKAIGLSPGYAEAYCNRGLAFDNLKQHEKAIADFNKALQLKPQFPLALFNRGVAKYKAGDKSGGCADLHKALQMDYQRAQGVVEKYCR